MAEPDPFDSLSPDRVEGEQALMLTLGGFEGPIHLLLHLARDQKVDLAKISILDLADQYLAFIAAMKREQLELAADYLVMAAWLAYLKSRLLLPEPEPDDDEPTGAEMAAALAFQLRRLEGMRKSGDALIERPQLGRDVWARGMPEGVEVVERSVYDATLYDLLKAYGDFKRRHHSVKTLTIEAPDLYSVDDAIHRLRTLLTHVPDWTVLMRFLPKGLGDGLLFRSAVCAHFVAVLELAKQGTLKVRQDGGTFGPIYVRQGDGSGDGAGQGDLE